jgi:hypothetical protein
MNDDTVFYIFGGAIAVAIALFVLQFIIRAWARYAVNSRVTITPQQVAKGDEINVTVDFTPRFPVTIDMIEISIECQRTYRERQGGELFSRRDRDTLEVDNVCKETVYIPFQGEVGAGENKSFSTPVTVPTDGVATKRASRDWSEAQHISIEWYVTVRINIKLMPDAIHRTNIYVTSKL